MNRFGILLAFAVFGAALGTSGPASTAEVSCWYNGGLHSCVWYPGYTYSSEYPYGFGLEALATVPLASSHRSDRASGDRPQRGGRDRASDDRPQRGGRDRGGHRRGGLRKLLRNFREDVLAL
jgi:hypothetical protein